MDKTEPSSALPAPVFSSSIIKLKRNDNGITAVSSVLPAGRQGLRKKIFLCYVDLIVQLITKLIHKDMQAEALC
jgi:hypothetical protein